MPASPARDDLDDLDDSLASARDLFDAGHYAGVVAVCSQALELRPRQVALLLLRARAWISLGRAASAIDDLRAVLSLDPRSGSAYRALGRLLLHEGELEAARRAFLGALTLDEGDREARSQLTSVDAALAVEAALAAEALALEEALALADDTGEVRQGGVPHRVRASAPSLHALRRMPTQPMPRASTSAASWRAPTMPLELALATIDADAERDGGQELDQPDELDERRRGRAATQRMERAATSAAPWRAPTMPLLHPAPPSGRRASEAGARGAELAACTPAPLVAPSRRAATAPLAPLGQRGHRGHGGHGGHGGRAGTAPTPARAGTVPLARRDD